MIKSNHNYQQKYYLLNCLLQLLFQYGFYIFLRSIWCFIDKYQNDQQKITITTIVCVFSSYIVSYSFFGILYYFEIPFFEQFKTNDEPWPWKIDKKWQEKKWKLIKLTVFNTLFVASLTVKLLSQSGMVRLSTTEDKFPSFFIHFLHFNLMSQMGTFMFYWSHRLLHVPFFYKRFHKIHHQYYNSIAFAVVYAHPFEYVIANVLPRYLGVFILGYNAHLSTFLVYIIWQVIYSNEDHSGYTFPISMCNFMVLEDSSDYHNFHHFKNIGNYDSQMVIWDEIFKTNLAYKEHKKKFGK